MGFSRIAEGEAPPSAVRLQGERGRTEMQELPVRGKGGIVRIRRERRRPIASHRILHDRNRLGH